MKNKYFAELARRLLEDRIFTEASGDRLSVLLREQAVMNVTQDGTVLLMEERSGNREAGELYHKVSELASSVKEYTSAMERAPLLEAEGLDQSFGYRVLADFNGVVLAGQALDKDWGYQFATWSWNPDHTGIANGDFYWNDFEGAKQSFAARSGLVQADHQFTDEQLAEVYRCIGEVMESGESKLTEDRRAKLQEVAKQIEHGVPDLDDLVSRSNGQELELNM